MLLCAFWVLLNFETCLTTPPGLDSNVLYEAEASRYRVALCGPAFEVREDGPQAYPESCMAAEHQVVDNAGADLIMQSCDLLSVPYK